MSRSDVTRYCLRLVTALFSWEMDKNWLEVWGVTYISLAVRDTGFVMKRNCTLANMCVRVLVSGQYAQALLARIAKDLIFNYWLGHPRDWSNGTILCGREGCQSYNWNKTLFFWCSISLCQKVGVGTKYLNAQWRERKLNWSPYSPFSLLHKRDGEKNKKKRWS